MPSYPPLFADRAEAGRRLAQRLAARNFADPVVFALPRGGVPVAVEVAKVLSAPVELLLVRKIGAPGASELALAAVVDGEQAQTVVNEDVARLTGAGPIFLERARQRELDEIERRRAAWLGDRPRVSAKGRTAIVVDDGLATGATAKAALRALRRQGASRIVLAVPVAPVETLAEMRAEADEVICLEASERFRGVGAFYGDFHQLSDEETLGLLQSAWSQGAGTLPSEISKLSVRVPPLSLAGDLQIPANASAIVLFAHGSGSSRHSPRNRAVADDLNHRGFATLLLDLLTEAEARDRRNVFDIPLLAQRLEQAAAWIDLHPALGRLPLGLFGASTGAAAALQAAAALGDRAAAVVSRGGRPDLAGEAALGKVSAATLLIVGAEDGAVIDLNRAALEQLRCPKAMTLVPRAGHLFEEPGTLEMVMRLAGEWFERHLVPRPSAPAKAEPMARPPATTPLGRLQGALEPLPPIDDAGFAVAFDRYAECRIVLPGEASHGTSEFYRARAAITRRLIEKHGFEVVAVEADWPDAAAVDRHVRLKPHREIQSPPFSRFPTWMWRNREFEAFVRWLRGHNAAVSPDRRTAFYGLDLYNMRASMAAVLAYLDTVDAEAAAEARQQYACLSPWTAEPSAYGMAALRRGFALCEGAVLSTLRDLVSNARDYASQDGEVFFDATQNARLVADAERYYRAMYFGSRESWNLRDRHMFETLEHVLARKGPKSKAVVWAHNSHVGDARFTDMGAERGELNIGQLCRERFGREAALIGFGTHTGTVMAADDWDEPGRAMPITPSRPDSYEALCHQTGIARFLLDLRPGQNEPARRDLREPRLERYIGVVYRPQTELHSHYALSSLPDQFDGFVWMDETSAVEPLPGQVAEAEDETYPFGL
jgi:erythromycin esterase-like protein/predicted phosphoribosyltransferase/dienelactone hydrolase